MIGIYEASEEKEKLTMDSHQRSSQVQETVAFLQRRAKEQKKKRLRLWEQAREDAEQILQYWIETYQPTRVWQWGSLLKREEFRDLRSGFCSGRTEFRADAATIGRCGGALRFSYRPFALGDPLSWCPTACQASRPNRL